MGVSKQKMLENTGIDETYLVQPDTYLTYAQYRKMKENANHYIDDPAFYLKYGTSINLTEHGKLGHLAFSCASFEEALKNTVKYIKILNRMYSLDAHLKGDLARLTMDTILPSQDLYVSEMEQMISALHKALSLIPNHPSVIKGVYFKYKRPAHADLYKEYIGDYCHFGCAENAIEFSTLEFKKYWNYGDPMIAKIAQKNLDEALDKMKDMDSLTSRIRELILKNPERFPKQEEVASKLNITSRTMARYLQRQNTSYQEIVDKLRQELAFEYLGTSSWTIDEIADMLGYSSAANFGRAFKKWTGKPPSEFRTKDFKTHQASV